MITHTDTLKTLEHELKSITQIKKELICPDCGDNLMSGGNCFYCFCGWSSCE